MRWYCKFCKQFTHLDIDQVCCNCQYRKKLFKYVEIDNNTEKDEKELQYSLNYIEEN